jgi:rhodanese-related sulfurtransferase
LSDRSILFALLTSTALAGCGPEARPEPEGSQRPDAPPTVSAPAQAGGYRDVSVTDLQGMLASKDFFLVNVHVPFEGDLPATDASIAYDQIERQLDRLPADRSAKIVLYCRSGSMSTQAARALAALGYTNVHQLSGAFNAWRAAGLPMAGG